MSTSKSRRFLPFDGVELVGTLICLLGLFGVFHAHDLYRWLNPGVRDPRTAPEDVCRTIQRLAERFENQTFDLRLQARTALRPTAVSDRLVLLTVDDHSVEQYGRWPWPRSHWARVMEALIDVGAEAIAFDVLFSDASALTIRPSRRGETYEVLIDHTVREITRFLDPEAVRTGDLFQAIASAADPATRSLALGASFRTINEYLLTSLQQLAVGLRGLVTSPDDELARAIADAWNHARIPTFGYTVFEERRTRPEDRATEQWNGAIRAVLDAGRDAIPEVLAGYREHPEVAADLELSRADLVQDLELALQMKEQFDRREEDLAAAAGVPLRKVLARTRRLKELLVRWSLEREIEHQEQLLSGASVAAESSSRADHDPRLLLRQALTRLGVNEPSDDEVFYQSLVPEILGAIRFRQRFALEVPGASRLQLPDHRSILTTVPSLLAEMKGSGSGNAHYDADGTMRRIPLLWSHQGRVYPHLGLSIGARLLGDGHEELQLSDDNRLRITFGDGSGGYRRQLELPLDHQGRLIVPWGGRWGDGTIQLFNVGPLVQYGFRLAERHDYLSKRNEDFGFIDRALFVIEEKRGSLDPAVPVPLAELVGVDLFASLDGSALSMDEAKLAESHTAAEWIAFLKDRRLQSEKQHLARLRVPVALLKQIRPVVTFLTSKNLEPELCALFSQKLEKYVADAGRKPVAQLTDEESRDLGLRGRALVADARRVARALETFAASLDPTDLAADPRLSKILQGVLPRFREEALTYSEVIDRVDSLRDELVERLKGKICLIGDVQTSGTDFAPTPLQDHYPKVGLQANTISSVLTGSAIRTTDQFFDRHVRLPHPLLYDLILWSILPIALLWILPVTGILRGNRVMLLLAFLYIVFCFEMLAFHDTWIPVVGPVLCMFGTAAVVTVRRYFIEERMKWRYRRSFETMVDPKIVDAVMENQDILEKLGGANYEVTAFFSDVAGFTTISELLKPDQLARMLTEYLTPMTDIIVHDFGGTRDKYIGDAIVAFWGAPLPVKNHAVSACLAALRQVERIKIHRAEWLARKDDWYLALLAQGLDIDFRIGLNTGVVKVGSFGSKGAVNYTMIGDAVNLAARLEGANKPYGTQIMISENTYSQAHAAIDVRELDILQVKGKLTGVRVYEVLAAKGQLDAKKAEVVDFYHKGLALYRQKLWDEALLEFEKALAIDPVDGPSLLYKERVQDKETLASLPADWSGVYVMKTK